ncbi:hypothetical protein ACIA8R_08690 [Nonomuraea sp. NPDC051191]|uniref:hypothetical protein n=1 Tax=Nonomuraea sp. NPDC051191 TaxID=3364372 RepID=UPI00378FC9CF
MAESIFRPPAEENPDIEVFPMLNGPAYLVHVTPDVAGQLHEAKDPKGWDITNQVLRNLMTVKAVTLTAKDSTAQKLWDPVFPSNDGDDTSWAVAVFAATVFNLAHGSMSAAARSLTVGG